MDKKSIVILLVASTFASSVFANSFINKLIPKHNSANPSMVKTHKITNETNIPYTDFSGTWIPNCGDGPGLATVIENDASYITLDGFEFRIGQGLQGMYQSNEDVAGDEHVSFEWNANGSALTMKSVGVYKENVANSSIGTDMGKFTLTMKNGQIILDGKWTMFEDVTQTEEPIAIHCVFSKKQ